MSSGGGLRRRADLGTLTDGHVQRFEALLSKSRVVTSPHDLESYNTDWLKQTKGQSRVVLRPKTVEEVSAIMRICSEENLAVCPQGGNTGLVGGSVPVFDEVIVSMSLMRNIIGVDPLGGTVSCEAGCVLEEVNSHVDKQGLMMPYDLGSKGSCQIGGNISTCAGGLRLIRYGSQHANLLGIQAVLANGDVLDCMSGHRKDNTGYHLRQLFLGAEGTLGIVTGAVINCPPKPAAVSLAFLGMEDYSNVLATLTTAKQMLSETLSSCEMMDNVCMEAVVGKLGLRSPLDRHNFYMVLETQASNQEHDRHKMDNFLRELFDNGSIQNGTVTSEPSKINTLWKLRERIIEGLSRDKEVLTYDLTFRHAKCYDIVHAMRERLKKHEATVSCCGHIGDGNVHLNIQADKFTDSLRAEIEPFVYDWTWKNGGSISAEHGIGLYKRRHLHRAKGTTPWLETMRAIKKTMDPAGILNPYKVIVDPREMADDKHFETASVLDN
ncbi:hypothetical protein AAG570_005185 [Ranatra chinensis]|uniref:D-2-hydroxyglutarate dehydrogenase, mitochondrial n=1 Tax=Ranatra chinensis TaxID=642074 RepID=A0ABD0YEL1_9HEMI